MPVTDPTARQEAVIATIERAVRGEGIAYTPNAGLDAALRNEGVAFSTAADGFNDIAPAHALYAFVRALEAALVDGQPALLRAIYAAERDRRVAFLNSRATQASDESSAALTDATGLTGTTL